MPFFKEDENHKNLCFAPSESFDFSDPREKEIFEIVKSEFYS